MTAHQATQTVGEGLYLELRQQIGGALSPTTRPFGEQLEIGLMVCARAAVLTGHLPTGKLKVQVLRRGVDAELERVEPSVYSMLSIQMPVRCVHTDVDVSRMRRE